MLGKSKLNFAVDLMILVAFLAATISGLVLLTMTHGGFRGGRNPDFYRTVLFLTRDSWNDVHVWSSLGLIAGIAIHLVLHWRWIVCMVRRYAKIAPAQRKPQMEQVAIPVVAMDGERRD